MRTVLTCLVLVHVIMATAQEDAFWAMPTHEHTVLFKEPNAASLHIADLPRTGVLLARADSGETHGWPWVQDGRGLEGYVAPNSLQPLSTWDDGTAVAWMTNVFQRQHALGHRLEETLMRESDTVKTAESQVEAIEDSISLHSFALMSGLHLFGPYFCRTGDAVLLAQLMRATAANPRAVNEEPLVQLGGAFRCRPEEYSTALGTLDEESQRRAKGATTTGVWMMFDERDPAQQAERDRLLKALK